MEGEPFRLLIIVLLFTVTAVVGFSALDNARESSEKAATYRSVSSLLIKTQIVLSGAPGSRETVNFVLEGDSRLLLYNDYINGTLYGIARASLPDGTHYLQVLPLPVGGERVSLSFNKTYIAGEHSIRLIHRVNQSGFDYLEVG
ncbi:MAG: hypothetical protein V3R86_05330 [Candidatus Hydrothermarchaeaceae archaeon]